MFGWTGTIVRVDLTKGKVTREATDPKVARDYLAPAASAATSSAPRSTPRPTPSARTTRSCSRPGR
jgi:hypothetical protein